ncbi:site-2 protease family protein [Candidatus Shapirobacteria bacterium CG_4_9_14_3_um_filter_36_12]|uniref:Site-2 protease family protein n=1 Tax=Candidatus Shapirobacteria bacterium CG_4_9_14_3_um_filter_36_12 TaxID=1974877 RepID=A0A2M7XNJ1_9BACT|nr:MAG: site-2 protease family protein [Candidatus Shapirobacteria bacterium CG_4_9_14_3_um_filter_36_12]
MDIVFSAIGLLIAVTIHEFSHALTADRLGDPTPQAMGRLTLNPLAHLDPLGTLMIFIAHFGWGKPVPIDPYNFKNPRRDEILVSLAGPTSNFIFMIAISLIIRFIPMSIFSYVLYTFAITNLYLGVFNLLPIPPLDGSKVFLNLMSVEKSYEWQKAFDRYGFFIVAACLFLPVGGSNIISLIVTPIVQFLSNLFF